MMVGTSPAYSAVPKSRELSAPDCRTFQQFLRGEGGGAGGTNRKLPIASLAKCLGV